MAQTSWLDATLRPRSDNPVEVEMTPEGCVQITYPLAEAPNSSCLTLIIDGDQARDLLTKLSEYSALILPVVATALCLS